MKSDLPVFYYIIQKFIWWKNETLSYVRHHLHHISSSLHLLQHQFDAHSLYEQSFCWKVSNGPIEKQEVFHFSVDNVGILCTMIHFSRFTHREKRPTNFICWKGWKKFMAFVLLAALVSSKKSFPLLFLRCTGWQEINDNIRLITEDLSVTESKMTTCMHGNNIEIQFSIFFWDNSRRKMMKWERQIHNFPTDVFFSS